MEHHRFVNSFTKKYNEYIDDTRPFNVKSNFLYRDSAREGIGASTINSTQ